MPKTYLQSSWGSPSAGERRSWKEVSAVTGQARKVPHEQRRGDALPPDARHSRLV